MPDDSVYTLGPKINFVQIILSHTSSEINPFYEEVQDGLLHKIDLSQKKRVIKVPDDSVHSL